MSFPIVENLGKLETNKESNVGSGSGMVSSDVGGFRSSVFVFRRDEYHFFTVGQAHTTMPVNPTTIIRIPHTLQTRLIEPLTKNGPVPNKVRKNQNNIS